jgi:acyl carrier protein
VTLEEFCLHLSQDVLEHPVAAEVELSLDEAGLDSFDRMMILVYFESELHIEVPLDLWESCTTIGDLYHHYQLRT